MRHSWLVLALASLFLFPRSVSASSSARLMPGNLEAATRALINMDRQAAGLPPLSPGVRLAIAARRHSLDMAVRHYTSHVTPEGLSPYQRMTQAGVRYRVAGENLGWDNGTDTTAMLQAIEVAMMNSPEHRANLLRSTFHFVGIGIAAEGDHLYVTEDFKG